MDQSNTRQRHVLVDARQLAAGAGDNDPAQSTLLHQQTGQVDVTHVDDPRERQTSVHRGRSTHSYERRQSTRDAIDDDRDTASEPAAAESLRYYRHLNETIEEDVSHSKSDMTDLRHTRRPVVLIKTDQRAEDATYSRQLRSNKALRLAEQHGDDVLRQRDELQDSRQYGHDVGRRHVTGRTTKAVPLERWTDDSPPHSRSTSRHGQQRRPVVDQPVNVPRRLVFRFVSSLRR